MYKLIAIDLDGTLLNTYGDISEYSKSVLKETSEKGIEMVFTSGRNIDSIKAISEEIGIQKYIIAGNGAVVCDLQNDNILYEKYIPKAKALNIIKICENNSISYSVYTNKTIVANSLKYNVLYYYKDNFKKEQNKQTSITIVPNIYDYVHNLEEENIMKIMICDKNQSVFNSIVKKIRNIDNIYILDVSHMSRKIILNGTEEVPVEYFYTEITEENVDKWFALEFLINKLDIDKSEVIAIGDNVNDKKMIENAGLGIVMKGSTPKLIEVADSISEFDNNNDGVAHTIEKYT